MMLASPARSLLHPRRGIDHFRNENLTKLFAALVLIADLGIGGPIANAASPLTKTEAINAYGKIATPSGWRA
jgi:hypothetical protein